jgi:hypothetical protein
LGINERNGCKKGTVGGVLLGGWENEGDEGELIWLMDFIQNRTMKPLATALRGTEKGTGGQMVEAMWPTYHVSLFGIFTMNPPCTMNIS